MAYTSTLYFYGGAGAVTGANFLLDTGSQKILVDCGLIQGDRDEYRNYEDFPYDPSEIDILIVTHAHMDHIGRIPKLVKEGFQGVIYSTPATKDLALVMFHDAVRIMARQAHRTRREPLYAQKDIVDTFLLWETREYHNKFTLGRDIAVQFLDAGHVLGSAMVEIQREGRKIVFTGDLGNSPAKLLPDTEKIFHAQYVVMESVYGDRNHEGKSERTEKLKKVLEEVHQAKGTLLIPSFSLQRTQVLLYEINNLVEDGFVESLPVYLDSPLATQVTNIFRRYTSLFKQEVQTEIARGDDIFHFPEFVIVSDMEQSFRIVKDNRPKVIIGGSGMSTGGRMLLHERRFLQNSNNIIVFVGYQAKGTLGRSIQQQHKRLNIEGHTVDLRAQVRTIQGYSAHKDSQNLVQFIHSTAETVEKIFVTMGETSSSEFLAQKIQASYDIETEVPKLNAKEILDL